MGQLVQTAAVFAAAAGINTGSVAIEQRAGFFTRHLGRLGWYVHLGIVLTGWAIFLLQLRGVGRRVRWPLPRAVRPFGTFLLLAAGGLWLAAFTELGPTRTGNGNVFGRGSKAPVTGGVFRVRANPMYDSYVLALVGLALRTRNAVYLPLAGEALLLCHGLEARIENRSIARAMPAEARVHRAAR